MPADIRMFGLSYLGGISRDKLKAIANSNQPNLNAFTVEKQGLIFAEVTPHAMPTLIDFFKFDDVQP